MNILITGINGFIGRNLAGVLRDKHNIYGLDLKTKNGPRDKRQIAIDLADHVKVRKYFSKFKQSNRIDIIVHLAAQMASVDNCRKLSILYDNLKITEGIVLAAEILNPKKIINFSSMAVYPNKDGLFNENSTIQPSLNSDCFYGLAKFCSENIMDFMLAGKNIIISHLRVSQVFGEGMGQDRLMPGMLRELKNKNTVTVFGGGRRISNFIHIAKLAEIVSFFIYNDYKGIYNVGAENLSYEKVAERIIKEYGNHKSRIIKEKKGSDIQFFLNTSKLHKIYQNKISR